MTPMGEMPSFDAVRESILIRRADRLELENAHLREALENEQKFSAATKARVAELEERCKRLEEAGDKMADVLIWSSGVRYKQSPTASAWRKAKEAKP